MINDDLSQSFLSSFEQRAYHQSEAGQFEREQAGMEADAARQKHEQSASDWLKSTGQGDAIPSPADYDYARMLADGVYPRPDGNGQIPLPPRYFKPGRLIVDGVDLATGKRIASRVPLEDRILGTTPDLDGDGEPDTTATLSQALANPDSELSPVERRALGAWLETQQPPPGQDAGTSLLDTAMQAYNQRGEQPLGQYLDGAGLSPAVHNLVIGIDEAGGDPSKLMRLAAGLEQKVRKPGAVEDHVADLVESLRKDGVGFTGERINVAGPHAGAVKAAAKGANDFVQASVANTAGLPFDLASLGAMLYPGDTSKFEADLKTTREQVLGELAKSKLDGKWQDFLADPTLLAGAGALKKLLGPKTLASIFGLGGTAASAEAEGAHGTGGNGKP